MATAPAIIKCLRRSDVGSCFTVFSSRLTGAAVIDRASGDCNHTPGQLRVPNTAKHCSLQPELVRARRPVKAIVVLLPRRATRRRAEGGTGSKRFMLGCDPAARREAHRFHAIHAHLHGRIPMNGAPAPRCGAPLILAATLRAGTSFGPWRCRKVPCLE